MHYLLIYRFAQLWFFGNLAHENRGNDAKNLKWGTILDAGGDLIQARIKKRDCAGIYILVYG
jgi:hypothetical protein